MDFKALREDKLKLTQEEFSRVYGVDLSIVKEWDQTNALGIEVIQRIIEKTGMRFEDIAGFTKPKLKAFDACYTWEKADFTKKSLTSYVNESLKRMDVSADLREKYIEDFQLGVNANLVKPSVSIVGRSDTGKSTLINSLIGMDKMPTSWTPTTSIAVYIKHIKERPDFIQEDAWVFANTCDGDTLWNIKRLYDEEYCKKWKIASGEIDILKTFGTRQGGGFSTSAGSAVIFVDAPILLNCDIVDLPGFGTETDSDDEITFKAAERTDVLIYLSQANGFMRIEDINYLKRNIKNLPVWEKKGENDIKPLANLFVVASQAQTVSQGNELELQTILSRGCENFVKTLSGGYWNARSECSDYKYSPEVLLERFFTYTIDIPYLCEKFTSELKIILEQLPDQIDKRAKDFVNEYVNSRTPSLRAELEKYEDVVKDREKYVLLLKDIDASELQRAADNDKHKANIKEEIKTLAKETKEEFSSFFMSTINVDSIMKDIKDKHIKNNKDELEYFASQLQNRLDDECSKLLKEKANKLSDSIQEYVSQYGACAQAEFKKANLDIDFDAGFAFVSALSKIGMIGGLGMYVAGQAAFLLCGMEFLLGIGGNIALGASFLGPIGMVAGLLASLSVSAINLFLGGWEKVVASKIVKGYDEKKILDQYCKEIKRYWEETETAFNSAAETLDQKWDEYVVGLRDTVERYEIEKIEENILVLKNIQHFFEHIPLS